MPQRAEVTAELPSPQDETECRRCGVHCDKVVYPAACLSAACPFLYAYEEWGHTYVGCMQNVYEVEIDLDVLRSAEVTRAGLRRRPRRAEAAADVPSRGLDLLRESGGGLGCVNPEFSEVPRGSPSFRIIASGTLRT